MLEIMIHFIITTIQRHTFQFADEKTEGQRGYVLAQGYPERGHAGIQSLFFLLLIAFTVHRLSVSSTRPPTHLYTDI